MADRTNITLSRVRPMATEAQEALAERVDHVFRQIEDYLRNFKAPDTSAVGGTPSEEVTSNRMVGLFIQTFDNDINGYWERRIGDGSSVTYPNNGTTGGKVFRADGHHFYEFPENIPYDPRMVYRLRCRVKIIAKDADGTGENQFRWGLQGYDASGDLVDRTGGTDPFTPHVVGADRDMDGDTLDTFVEIDSYVSGHSASGAGSPGTMDDLAPLHNDVSYVRPYFEVNADGGDGTMEVDYLAFDVLTVDDEIDALLTRNGPIEADAEQTAGKDFSLLASRFFENLLRDSTDNTKLSVVVSKVDNAGDLEEFVLIDDGAEKRVITKGKQEGSAADGDTVSFDPVFNDTPTVLFRPTGVTWSSEFRGDVKDDFDGSDEVAISVDPADPGVMQFLYELDVDISGDGDELIEVEVELQEDPGTGSFSTVRTHRHHFRGVSEGTGNPNLDTTIEGIFTHIDGSASSDYNYKIVSTVANTVGSPTHTVTLTTRFALYAGVQELFWKVVADGLSASGFDLVAKIIERNISTTEQTESFPSGTITSVGGTHALGGLSDDPDTDEIEAQFDGSLSVTSTSTLQDHDDDFPAGVLDAENENKEVSVEEANDDTYDVRYDVDMEATAAEQGGSSETIEDTFPSGTLNQTNDALSVTLSETADDDSYEAFFNINSMGTATSVTVAVETQQSGGSTWTQQNSASYSTTGAKKLSFTDANVGKNDKVRLIITATDPVFPTTDPEVDPDKVQYTATTGSTYEARIDMTVEVQSSTDNGSSWSTENSTTYEVDDTDGNGDSLDQSVEKSFTRSGVTDVRVIVTDITETGSFASQTHECDPNDVQYQTGEADSASYQITVAVDAKDGANAWVEKATKQYSVSDNSGSGNTKNLTDEILAFVDANINSGDDVRLRVKSDSEGGSVDSSSFSIDPELVRYWDVSGPETEHSMTPLAGDSISWVALTG